MELDRERMFRVGLEGIKQVHITELLSTRDEVRQLREEVGELSRVRDTNNTARADATHPPVFLAQSSRTDMNADLCACKYYHRTLIANGQSAPQRKHTSTLDPTQPAERR